jgi:YHS domain-containing protein
VLSIGPGKYLVGGWLDECADVYRAGAKALRDIKWTYFCSSKLKSAMAHTRRVVVIPTDRIQKENYQFCENTVKNNFDSLPFDKL